MKKLLLFVLLSVLANNAQAQSLSFFQLLTVFSKAEDVADDYLLAKGWERAPNDGDDVVAKWAYGRRPNIAYTQTESTQGLNYEAKGWITLIKDEEKGGITLLSSVYSVQQFIAMRKQILAAGMTKTGYKTRSKYLESTYEGANYRARLTTYIGEATGDSSNSYTVEIEKK